MQKKLTVLFAFAIFVLVVGWAITPVQAHCEPPHDHKKCPGGNGNGDGDGGGPRIGIVTNQLGGTAAAYITKVLLGGSYTKLQIKAFNNGSAEDLRARFDVLHFAYQSPRTIQASWTTKLLAFM